MQFEAFNSNCKSHHICQSQSLHLFTSMASGKAKHNTNSIYTFHQIEFIPFILIQNIRNELWFLWNPCSVRTDKERHIRRRHFLPKKKTVKILWYYFCKHCSPYLLTHSTMSNQCHRLMHWNHANCNWSIRKYLTFDERKKNHFNQNMKKLWQSTKKWKPKSIVINR